MAVTHEDLLQPTGEIEAAWFPGDDAAALQARLETYIAEGVEASADVAAESTDTATKAYAYWRAYQTVYLRLSGSPASVGVVGHLNRQYTQGQLSAFSERAAYWRSVFDGYRVGGDGVTQTRPVSQQTRAVFEW